MPYTLLNFALWFALAAIIGGVIGWLLRSLTCRAEVARARMGQVDRGDAIRPSRSAADPDAPTDAPADEPVGGAESS